MQYGGVLAYRSIVTGNKDTIKIEISLREPAIKDVKILQAATLLVDPFKQSPVADQIEIRSLAKQEAYAEKLRAALTRREPAIRDFFDLDYAIHNSVFDFSDAEFITLVKKKLAIPGNPPVSLAGSRIEKLKNQLEAELRPVLRAVDFNKFNLDNAIQEAAQIASKLSL